MAVQTRPRSLKGRAVLCARMAQDKQAKDLLILDLSELESAPAEFFVVATVESDAQMRAVCESIHNTMKSMGFGAPRIEGKTKSSWTILDYFDIVVHVMRKEAREFYKLERLWGDAKSFTLTASGVARSVPLLSRRSAV